MADDQKDVWTLGRPAKDAYDDLAKDRQGPLEKGRELSAIIIPSLLPPDGYKSGDTLPPPNQSFLAKLANTLASKLMLVAFPPGQPMMRHEIIEHKLQGEIDADPELYSEIELALSRKEEAHRKRLASTNITAAYTEFMRLLLAGGGNALWQQTDIDYPVVHKMDSYVVERDSKGRVQTVILKETIKFVNLKGPHKQLVRLVQQQKGLQPSSSNLYDEVVDIYTVQKLDGDEGDQVWLYWQEYEGTFIPDTDAEAPLEVPILYAGWLVPRYKQNWGGSYAEEYEGDMFTVENHRGSLNDGSEFASFLLWFLKPGSATSKRSIEEAENGKILTGDAEDLSTPKTDKNADFGFVMENLEAVKQDLAAAWLAMSSIQRDAERVTAEEIRALAGELDQAMGGLYTVLAQGPQRHVVKRFLQLHEETDEAIPQLPKEIVSTSVITGIDALGRSVEFDKLVTLGRAAKETLGEAVAQEFNPGDYTRRLCAALGIKPDGLVKSREQKAAEAAEAKQDMTQQTLLEEGTAPVAKAAADGVSKCRKAQPNSKEPQ